MNTWHTQATHIRRALAYDGTISEHELLLPRTLDGTRARALVPPPGVTPREAAVLLLFYPHAPNDGLMFPLTVRSALLETHRGEVSLPGGALDPDDPDLTTTALREAHEELGIVAHHVEVWGELKRIYIPPSNFSLTPIVGFLAQRPQFLPNPGEIADMFEVSLETLLSPATVVVEEWQHHGIRLQVPFFALGGHKVWGATALVLSELVTRLRRTAI